jgi:tetratricopeptide (TPR) repeat protein
MSLADVYFAQSGDANGSGKIIVANRLLDQYTMLTRDYEQEVLVQSIHALFLQKRMNEAARRVESFLDIDPEQTENHVHDWMVFRGRANWGLLLDTLKKVAADMTQTPRLTAALGLAMYKGREKLEGAQTIEQALSQAPKDPLLMALAGWVELKLGRKETAVVNIKQAALETETLKLPHILQARLFEEDKDFEGSRKEWEKVLKLDSRSVEALQGLALAAWNHQDRNTSQSFLTQLYANDPSYIPYLQLTRLMRTSEGK